ncbi:MAG: M2 family metallopeptidase [Candidatus Marinimicrobia bacterium]|nr:M2 family metallopeptidase [Candidatus Neomarinimicrobiota bacterium]
MKRIFTIIITILLVVGCTTKPSRVEMESKQLIDSLTAVIEPLLKERALAYWNATGTGEDKYYERYAEVDMELTKIYSNNSDFKKLEAFKNANIKDPVLARTVEVLYLGFLANQTDPELLNEITKISTEVEQKFNTFRGKIDGKNVTGNDIKKILSESTDVSLRKKAWEASKQVATVVEDDFLKLVKLRNESARSMGFDNYYQMSLIISEQDPAEIQRIFDELDKDTKSPFMEAKREIDQVLAKRFGIEVDDLRPWHYSDPFFQEAPVITEINLDRYYQDKDVVELARRFYNSIDINVDQILANSDLYEREGKYPHAYCTDIDRKGDVRVMMNVHPTESWMSTSLHELGHAIYDLKHDLELPFFLREPAHAFTTEAVAIFFERLSKNPNWMQEALGLTDEQKQEIIDITAKTLRLEKLVFARWSLVMLNFEKELYANPDQDLNKLWWDIVEKYQMIKRPENRNMPDYAAKIHVCLYPVYYHNYQLGGLLVAQFLNAIAVNQGLDNVSEIRFMNNPEIGKYFIENVFKAGKRYRWDEMIIRATGEKLTSKYFVEQL